MLAKRFGTSWLLLLLAAALVLAACGGRATTSTPSGAGQGSSEPTQVPDAAAAPTEAEQPSTTTSTAADASARTGEVVPPANADELQALEGDILVDGSSTVYPVTQAAAEEFRKYAPNVRTTVGVSGTGGGFKKFCAGETDISDASRPIKEEEVALCKQNGIEYIELPVAYDGLAILANPANDWAECLTVEELKKVWEPAAQGQVANWNQIREGFPDRPLALYGPGTDSGTFDYFTDAVVGEEGASRGDFTPSEDDNVLVQGISGDENALGYFGYAYYQANAEALKLVAVDSGDGKCVLPSIETVKDGTYQPLSRPIFIYVKKESAAKPQVKAFVDFYLSDSFTPLVQSPEVGYIALSDELYNGMAQRFGSGTTGSAFEGGSQQDVSLEERYLSGE